MYPLSSLFPFPSFSVFPISTHFLYFCALVTTLYHSHVLTLQFFSRISHVLPLILSGLVLFVSHTHFSLLCCALSLYLLASLLSLRLAMFIPSVHPSIIHPSICIYVYVHPPVHSFLCPPSDHLSIMHPSINIHTSIHPSVIHPSSHPSSLPSLRPSVLPPICPLSVYQSTIHPCSHICSPIHSSVHPSIYHPIAGCIIHLSIIHPNIFKHPFVHLPIHSSTIQPFTCHSSSHPCIFIHLFLYLSIHPFNHSFIIHPSTHPSVRLFTRYSSSNPALSRSLFYPVPVSQYIHSHQPWSCPIPGLLVCLALSLIPSLCLPPSFSRQRCCSPIQPTASFWPLTPVPLGAPAPPHPPGPNPPTPRVSPSASGLLQAPHTFTGAGKSPHTLHSLLSLLWPLLLS